MTTPTIIGQEEYRGVWAQRINELVGVVVFQDRHNRYVPAYIWAVTMQQFRGKQTFEKLIEAQRAACNMVAAIGWQIHEQAITAGLEIKEGDDTGMVPLVAAVNGGLIIPGGSTQQ